MKNSTFALGERIREIQIQIEEDKAMSRLTREEYYVKVVNAVSERGSCDRGRSGAILVKCGRIIASGYVGSPSGTKHCDEIGHELEKRELVSGPFMSTHCIRTVHAEMNAILQAARYGPSIEGATLYSTMFPCYDCAKAIVNSGIVEVVSLFDYQRSHRSKILFDEAGIRYKLRSGNVLEYPL